MKVAKLVAVSLMTRVVVENTASEKDIANAAKDQLKEVIENDIHDNIEFIEDDTECPFDPEND